MMTTKLYYLDAYIKEFDAEVVSWEEKNGLYDVVLDRTAFFPEEGGQSSDGGNISGIKVLSVYEEGSVVHHIVSELPNDKHVHCELDFDERFEKMQCHTAEHILCGIIHRLFGLDNVGFHLGEDEVTFDISAPLTRDELDEVERLANEAVFACLPVDTFFPSGEELPTLEYRSKLELTENVRIVKIGDVDSCACCAPHVKNTGEIGLIKILDFMKHRGGLRINMCAGRRALRDYSEKYGNVKKISAMLSVPQHETADALSAYMNDVKELKYQLKLSREELCAALADAVPKTDGNYVRLLPDFSMDDLRAFANSAKSRIGGMLVLLSGEEGNYKYIIASESVDLTVELKEIKSALAGGGGGKSGMVQGSFLESYDRIKEYFI